MTLLNYIISIIKNNSPARLHIKDVDLRLTLWNYNCRLIRIRKREGIDMIILNDCVPNKYIEHFTIKDNNFMRLIPETEPSEVLKIVRNLIEELEERYGHGLNHTEMAIAVGVNDPELAKSYEL